MNIFCYVWLWWSEVMIEVDDVVVMVVLEDDGVGIWVNV